MTKEQTKWLKGITIILMLVHHLFTWGGATYNSVLPITLPKGYDIPHFIGVFGKLCVTIYLFLSGYGFACKYAEKNQNLDIHKIGRSIVGIYRKYLLVFFIFFTIGLLIGKRTFNVKEWILNLIAFDTTYNKECWFLFIYILLLVIVLPLLYAGENKYTWKIRLIISFSVICSGYGLRLILSISGLNDFMQTRLYFNLYYFLLSQFSFVLGWICRETNFIEILMRKIKGIISISIVMAVVIILKVYCPGGMLIDSLLTPIFLVCCLKFNNKNKILDNMLIQLGALSTYMWMTHSFYNIYYFDEIIYGFKYPIIITIVLIVISAITAEILEYIEKKLVQV